MPKKKKRKKENSGSHFLPVPSFQKLISSLSNIMKESKIQKTSRRSSCFKARWKWKLLSCVRLCNPMDCSLLGSSVHGILQARILVSVAIPFCRGSPKQGLNRGLQHCRWILYQLSHQESPRILEWVACPFSRGSSWPRNRTRISCIAGGFFTNWAISESLKKV